MAQAPRRNRPGYTLTQTNGVAATNEVVFTAGQTQAKINVNAVNDAVQQTRPRRVQVTLSSSPKDGLTNADEERFSTDPQDDDTDNDGQKDFEQRYRPVPGSDYLAIRLRTLDTGKVNNGANCAVCHTTRLKVGDYSLYSAAHGHAIEQIFSFRKGNSYPIWLQEVSRQHIPTTNTGNTPTNSGKYNANILAATDELPAAFVVQDPNNKLGTNQPWTNFPTDPTVAVGTLIVPKIEVTWEDVPNSGVLETNPAPGGGFRYYPDQQSPSDTIDRRRLFVRVKTIPPLPDQRVLLKSFDVDDPTPLADDPSSFGPPIK